jgi:hypothetical protein
LSITNHDSDRAEVQAFRDKTSYGLKKVMVMAAILVEITVLIALEPRITGIM